MGKKGSGKIERKCHECDKLFLARVDRVGKYCSLSCANKNKIQKTYKVNKICLVCDKNFIVKRYRIESAMYCSSECRRKRMPKKDKHPRWKGGISRTWQSKVIIKKLINEKGKCELCKSNKNLQGHHIIPYCDNKNMQSDENNIQILCIKCHASMHPEISNFILRGQHYE